jgi:hypothetical protein
MKRKFVGILLAAALAVAPATSAFAAGSSTAVVTSVASNVTVVTVTSVEEFKQDEATAKVYEAMPELVETIVKLSTAPETVTKEDIKATVAALKIEDSEQEARIESALSGELLAPYVQIQAEDSVVVTEEGKYQYDINIPTAAGKVDGDTEIWITVILDNGDGTFTVDAVKALSEEEAAAEEAEAEEAETETADAETTAADETVEDEEKSEVKIILSADGTVSITSDKVIVGLVATEVAPEETTDAE